MKRALLVASLVLACTREGGGPGAGAGREAPTVAKNDRAALEAAVKAAGGDFGEDDCGVWPPSFPRVVVVGMFAHDRGCDLSGMLIDGKWVTENTAVPGLATRGFAGAAPEEKQKLARAWVEEVVHGFGGSFVGAPELAFEVAAVAYTPVTVRAEGPDVVVEGWVREPSGMRWESAYTLVTYRFAEGGKLSVAGKQRFAVEGERLQAAEAAEAQIGREK